MKRNLLLCLAALSLCACSQTPVSESSLSSSSESLTTESSSESSSESSLESSSSKPASVWGETNTEIILGSLGVDLPYLPNEGYEVVLAEDDYGDPLVEIFCYYEDESTIRTHLGEYANIMMKEGYEVEFSTDTYLDPSTFTTYTYDVYYAGRTLDSVFSLEVQFLEGKHNGKECLGIFAYTYPVYANDVWPTNLVEYLLGHDIPHLPEDGYRYECGLFSENGDKYLFISMQGAFYDEEEAYFNLLVENDFLIDGTQYDEYGYLARDFDYEYGIQFKFSLDYGTLDIMIYPF